MVWATVEAGCSISHYGWELTGERGCCRFVVREMVASRLFAEADDACEDCTRETAALLRSRGRRFVLVVRQRNLVHAG
jgi:hypothetical protein